MTKFAQDVEAIGTVIGDLRKDRDALMFALTRMVMMADNLTANTDGRYPEADPGCIECTAGTVPDRRNTGLCAYHNAKSVLSKF